MTKLRIQRLIIYVAFRPIPSFQILSTNILLCCSVLPIKINVITGKIIIQHVLFFNNIFVFSSKVLIISKARGHTFVTTGLKVCGDK